MDGVIRGEGKFGNGAVYEYYVYWVHVVTIVSWRIYH